MVLLAIHVILSIIHRHHICVFYRFYFKNIQYPSTMALALWMWLIIPIYWAWNLKLWGFCLRQATFLNPWFTDIQKYGQYTEFSDLLSDLCWLGQITQNVLHLSESCIHFNYSECYHCVIVFPFAVIILTLDNLIFLLVSMLPCLLSLYTLFAFQCYEHYFYYWVILSFHILWF